MVKAGTVWRTELPDEPGDWLYVKMWSCGCCPCFVGIADIWLLEPGDEVGNGRFDYEIGGRKFGVCWQTNTPPHVVDGKIDVDGWMKIDTPAYRG